MGQTLSSTQSQGTPRFLAGPVSSVPVLPSLFMIKSWGIGSSAFLIFEHIMSAGEALKLFGTSPLSGASVLYLANLVFPLLTSIISLIVGSARMSDKSCGMMSDIDAVLGLLQWLPWAAFFGMRTYALSKHLLLALLVLVLALVPFGATLAQFALGLTSLNDPILGCSTGINLPHSLINQLIIASQTCLIGAVGLVLAVTWSTMPRRYCSTSESSSSTLSRMFLRDGTMYLFTLLVLSGLNLVVPLSGSIGSEAEGVTYTGITTITEPLMAVIISRFLLDLQVAHRRALESSSNPKDLPMSYSEKSDASLTRSPIFDRVFGSLGASIIPAWLSSGDSRSHEKENTPARVAQVMENGMTGMSKSGVEIS